VREYIKKYSIKNVIFFGASELKSLYFSFLGLDINLIIRHGTTKSSPKKDWFHKLIYSDVNYHVAICKHLEKNVNYIIPFGKRTKSKLIYSSFNFKKVIQKEHKKLSILHVGRIADAKGQTDAIKACEILVRNKIDFVFNIVGGFDASYKKEFLEFYNSCTYKEYINLIGFTTDVRSYIEQADIFLFPSYGEGLSNAFLEAISNNLISISYNNTSFPELYDLGLCFQMSEDRNIQKLQESLLYSVQNIQQEKEKSNNNFDIVKNIFSLEKEMNSYLEILQ
jgi:glycosyltransferase involved in cell wall biosynthesis